MARTYGFEHYTVPKKETNLIPEEEKKEYVEARPGPAEAKIHYGQKYARTKEMAAAKRAQRAKAADRAAQTQASLAGDQVLRPLDVRERLGSPIGSLPAPEEPPLEQQGMLGVLAGRASARMRLARLAARDLAVASWKLAMLPFEAARMAARRLAAREG